ncbi:helix-turn-helix transcriptional regulator [Microvirga massiliensis]|uniref:helix-turn-helix transcriptional regulator n=1 Tax=Microvirga massiliensis TaxID=1033741 RepID=UPI0006611747|nr:helix-turn-helix transcriptional regulator [Microvirga massiliensis]
MAMTGQQMRALRERLGSTQEQFGIQLGLNRATVVAYEKGTRGGQPLPIPRSIELACAALAEGITSYIEKEDELKIDVFRLWTRSGLRADVQEWCLNNLKKPVVFHIGVATFSDVADAVLFKLYWSDQLA